MRNPILMTAVLTVPLAKTANVYVKLQMKECQSLSEKIGKERVQQQLMMINS